MENLDLFGAESKGTYRQLSAILRPEIEHLDRF